MNLVKASAVILFFALAALSAGLADAATCTVVGAQGAAPVINLNFTPPTLDTDGITPVATPLKYQIWQGTAPGAEVLVSTTAAGVPSPIVINTGLLSGLTYYVKIAVVDANGAISALSNEGCKLFPNGIPGTVTITIS